MYKQLVPRLFYMSRESVMTTHRGSRACQGQREQRALWRCPCIPSHHLRATCMEFRRLYRCTLSWGVGMTRDNKLYYLWSCIWLRAKLKHAWRTQRGDGQAMNAGDEAWSNHILCWSSILDDKFLSQTGDRGGASRMSWTLIKLQQRSPQ